jgi:hypothetical protein
MDDAQSNFTHQVSTDDKSQTSSMFLNKPKMTKKDLAAFMKAKLGQTKISSSVTTQVSAIGPPKTNFQKQVKPSKPPMVKRKQSESDEEDWAKANMMLNRPMRQTDKVAKRKTEEHKVIDTSKNIYKPCFNMPARTKTTEHVKGKTERVSSLRRSSSKGGIKKIEPDQPKIKPQKPKEEKVKQVVAREQPA